MKIKNQNWAEFTITIHRELADVLSEYIVSRLGRGIFVKDTEDAEIVRLVAYLSDEDLESNAADEITRFVSRLNAMNAGLPMGVCSQKEIKDEDWGQSWKLGFKPVHIGKRFVIRPSWETYKARPGELVIEIDPGQAFGTGTHQTTAMVLEAMETLWEKKGWDKKGQGVQDVLPDVIDVGTGTGILGIGARLLGAKKVLCVDIDPVAVEVARENMKKNGLGDVLVTNAKLENINDKFDVILANLDKKTLMTLSSLFKLHLKTSGVIILSGILAEQKNEIVKTFEAEGLAVEMVMTDLKEAEWVCIGLSNRT
ncbi:MAG: 50S ribosomal protein L11 methyltransferase [Dissulfurimicrobium sp.]|uniref:50S ribosomal protein L11 methyltransferase n=1 Tax=Dissulfurimicrobium TaxID=1769732 RepID=UPI003C792F1C